MKLEKNGRLPTQNEYKLTVKTDRGGRNTRQRNRIRGEFITISTVFTYLFQKHRHFEFVGALFIMNTEQIKRELQGIHICGCRCNEGLKAKTDGSK